MVDTSAPKILGVYLLDKEEERSLLFNLAQSDNLWKQRIAILSTFTFIRNNQFEDTITLATQLLEHPHDLIHKALGWMLREIGKRDKTLLMNFLDQHYHQMPRTMLRYAIEKFTKEERTNYLKGRQ